MRDKIDPFQSPSSESCVSQQNETVVRLPLTELHPFKGYPALRGVMPRNQPYLVRDDDPTMIQLVARVQERGVTYPGVVRPDPEGGYEIISGQRRHRASELAGIPDMPVIVRNLDDEEAVTEMIDSNVNREDVLPSERAWACRMRLEVEKRRAGRPGKNSPHHAANFRSDDEIGKSLGISGDTLRRFAALTELIAPLLDMVDNKQLGVTPAAVLSALTRNEQALVLDAMEYSQNTPSVSQAQRLKKASQEGTLTEGLVRAVLSEEKKAEAEKVSFPLNAIRKYFPRSYTPQRMQETILKLLEAWQKKRQRGQER